MDDVIYKERFGCVEIEFFKCDDPDCVGVTVTVDSKPGDRLNFDLVFDTFINRKALLAALSK